MPKKLLGKNLEVNTSYGDFDQNTAVKIFIAENSNHLTEAWDNNLIKELVKFASRSVNKNFKGDFKLEKISLKKIIIKFAAGLIILIGIMIYFQNLILNNSNSKIILILSSLFYFSLFFTVWSSTISKYFFGFGPYFYKWPKYLLVSGVMIFTGTLFTYIIKKYKKDSFLIDMLFIIVSILLFIFISSFFVFIPAFSYGGSIILFKVLIVFITIVILAILFNKLQFFWVQRLLFYSLSFIWLLPIVIPAK